MQCTLRYSKLVVSKDSLFPLELLSVAVTEYEHRVSTDTVLHSNTHRSNVAGGGLSNNNATRFPPFGAPESL